MVLINKKYFFVENDETCFFIYSSGFVVKLWQMVKTEVSDVEYVFFEFDLAFAQILFTFAAAFNKVKEKAE